MIRLKNSLLVGFMWCIMLQCTPLQAQNIKTLLGGGLTPGIKANVASIGQVSGLTVDPSGDVYIADRTHSAIYKVNAGGELVLLATGVPTTPTVFDATNSIGFASINGMAADGKGNLYVADANSGFVYQIPTSGGTPKIVAGCGIFTANFTSPGCSGLKASGGIGDNGPATMASMIPAGLAFDLNGNLLIADFGNCVIRQVSFGASNQQITTIAGTDPVTLIQGQPPKPNCEDFGQVGPATETGLTGPMGVAVDSKGNIFIAETGIGNVREVCESSPPNACGNDQSSIGKMVVVAGNTAVSPYSGDQNPPLLATQTSLVEPVGVAIDASGNIYIADIGGDDRILEVCASSTSGPCGVAGGILTIAGTGQIGYTPPDVTGGFPAPTANSLNVPLAVALGIGNTAGSLLIADSLNFRVAAIGMLASSDTFAQLAGNGAEDDVHNGTAPTDLLLGALTSVSEDAASNVYAGLNPPRVIEAIADRAIAQTEIVTVAGTGIVGNPISSDGNNPAAAQLQPPYSIFLDDSDDIVFSQGFYGVQAANTNNEKVMTSYGVAIPASTIQAITPPSNTFSLTSNNSTYFYYTDLLNIFKSGTNGPLTSAPFSQVSGMCTDRSGNIYVSDIGAFNVSVINTGSAALQIGKLSVPPGATAIVAGSGPSSTGQSLNAHMYLDPKTVGDGGLATMGFVTPTACFVDNLGNIYIADTANDRIRRIDVATGDINTVAGGQNPGFSGDNGPAANAQLSNPNAIWGDQAGNLLVGDFGNHRIREISNILPVPTADLSCPSCILNNISASTTTITLTNTCSSESTNCAPLIFNSNPSLSDPKDFTMKSTCPLAGSLGLPVGQNCTVVVSANSGLSKNASTVVNFFDNAYLSNANASSGPVPDPGYAGQWAGYQQSQAVSFSYESPAATYGPATLVLTSTNEVQPILVTNTEDSPAPLVVSHITPSSSFLFEPNPSGISVGQPPSCGNPPFTLLAGKQCNIYIALNPSTPQGNAINGSVTIADNTIAGTDTTYAQGYALIPTPGTNTSLSLTNGSSAGAPASFNLLGVPASTDFKVSCVVTPAGLNWNCTPNASGQTVSVQVSIPSCLVPSATTSTTGVAGSNFLPMGLAFAGSLLLPWRCIGSRRRRSIFLKALLLCLIFGGLSACNNTSQVSSKCVAYVNPGNFTLNVSVSPTSAQEAGAFPTLTNDADTINVQ